MNRSMVWLVAMALVVSMGCAAEANLRVMSYNLRYGIAPDGENAWPKRRDLVVESIRAHEPDVVGMQECLRFQADYIEDHLRQYRWWGVGREASGGGEMTAILYHTRHLSPMASGHFWLSETPEIPGSVSWDSSLTRMVSWVRFRHLPSNTFFLFFNTHFDHKGEAARAQSALLLKKHLADIDPSVPVVLTGDFNAHGEKSRPWTTLVEAGLCDAWLEAPEREGPVTTWCGFAEPDPASSKRIDWVLLRGPVEAKRCETVVFHREGRYPSDHFPVLADLTFTP